MDAAAVDTYLRVMIRWLFLAVAVFVAAPAHAQALPPPELDNRIPSPLPPPSGPPLIYGPATQDAPPAVLKTPRTKRLNTLSDRVTQCLQTAGNAGVGQADADAYVRACANTR